MDLPYETSNSNLSSYPQFFPLETLERVLIVRFNFYLFLNVSEMFPPSHLKVSCFQGTNCQPWWKGWWPSAAWEKDSGQGWFEWVWNSLGKIKSWKMSVFKRTVVWGVKIQTVLWLQHHHITGEDPPLEFIQHSHHWGRLPLKFRQHPHHWGRLPPSNL